MTVKKGRLLFFTIIGFVAFIIIIDFFGDAPSNNIHNFNYNEIKTLRIEDRGLRGNEEIIIKSPEELKQYTELLKTSDLLSWNSVNMKANQGLCELHLVFTDNKYITLTLTNTSFNGGIVSSGNYYYRNDSLLFKIMDKLKSN